MTAKGWDHSIAPPTPAAWGPRGEFLSLILTALLAGVDYLHPDLVRNMWINTGEIPGDGIDNDGNGYIDGNFAFFGRLGDLAARYHTPV